MKNEEFNIEKISNEKDGFSSFEFGFTQNDESTSYSDNSDTSKDELNDTSVSNSDSKDDEKKKEEDNSDQIRDSLNNNSSDSSSSSSSSSSSASSSASSAASGASAATSVTAVAGVSMVAVASISTLVGINLYVNAKVEFDYVEVDTHLIAYSLELSETNDDRIIITLNNKPLEYYDEHPLEEGHNDGIFSDLVPDTEYELSVIDVTSDDYVVYTKTYRTLKKEETEHRELDFSYDPVAIVEENSFRIYLDYNEEDAEHISNVIFYITDPESLQTKSYAILLTKEAQFICLDAMFEGDVGFDVLSQGGFAAHLQYSYDDEVIYTPSKHLDFTSDEVEPIYVFIYFMPGDVPVMNTMDPVRCEVGTQFVIPESTFEVADETLTFSHWYSASIGDLHPGESIYIQESLILNAVWTKEEAVEYALINLAPGASVPVQPDTVAPIEWKIGTEYVVPECPFESQDPDYTFDFWICPSYANDLYPGDIIMITESSIILTAIWKYVPQTQSDSLIMFSYGDIDVENPSAMENLLVPEGSEYTLPDCIYIPSDNTYEFVYWEVYNYADPFKQPGDKITIQGDTAIVACWQQQQTGELALINLAPGASVPVQPDTVAPIEWEIGTEYVVPECPFESQDPDYTFDFWICPSYANDLYPGDIIMITESSIILTAIWKYSPSSSQEMVRIMFDPFDIDVENNMEDVYVAFGSEYTLPDCTYIPIDKTYSFIYWEVLNTLEEKHPGDKITIQGETTIRAHWGQQSSSEYSVAFDGNGAENWDMETLYVQPGDTINIPMCYCDGPDGMMFFYWEINGQEGIRYYPEQEYTVTGNVVFSASWHYPSNVTFNPNNGIDDEIIGVFIRGEEHRVPGFSELGFTLPEGKQFLYWKYVTPVDEIYIYGEDLFTFSDESYYLVAVYTSISSGGGDTTETT